MELVKASLHTYQFKYALTGDHAVDVADCKKCGHKPILAAAFVVDHELTETELIEAKDIVFREINKKDAQVSHCIGHDHMPALSYRMMCDHKEAP
jgi:hypothetical protein